MNAHDTKLILALAAYFLFITVIISLALKALFFFIRLFWKPILCLISFFIAFVIAIWAFFKIGGLM